MYTTFSTKKASYQSPPGFIATNFPILDAERSNPSMESLNFGFGAFEPLNSPPPGSKHRISEF